ncbi:MAG TPA: hypothetical protein VKI19_08815, partial [Acidimicrobiales bacterium]|nr:hypothetical protein [Acidimicrobiales bacterium]
MSLTQAQLQFAAEFVTLVVTASALALLLLRPEPRRFEAANGERRTAVGRLVLALVSGLALSALAGASFVHGSLLVKGHAVVWIGL